jgi:hypothetical protein
MVCKFINHYNIYYLNRFSQEWEFAIEVPATELKAKVPELKEKSELQFRITAVNKAGPSPASEPTKIHIVKHKSCTLNYTHVYYITESPYSLINYF